MEEGFGWDATAVQAYTARNRFAVDERHIQAEIGGQESGSIAAWPGSQDDEFPFLKG
jgi:hypothetical protein